MIGDFRRYVQVVQVSIYLSEKKISGVNDYCMFDCCLKFCIKSYIEGIDKNNLCEAISMSTQNPCICIKVWNKYYKLS